MWYPKAEGEYPRRDNSKRGLPSRGWDCNHWAAERSADPPGPELVCSHWASKKQLSET